MLGQKHHHLVFATGGVKALRVMRETRPDLVHMDFMTPVIDGLVVVRKIKVVPRLAEIPVVMINGKSEKISSLKA